MDEDREDNEKDKEDEEDKDSWSFHTTISLFLIPEDMNINIRNS